MDLVVFSNHMNKMNLGILKDKELDLFMSICLKLRDEGTKKIELEFSELKGVPSGKCGFTTLRKFS